MYSIKKEKMGTQDVYRLTFSGFVKKDEMEKWVADSGKELKTSPKEFGVLVDMKDLKPLDKETQTVMVGGQVQYKEKGMVRSAVVVAQALVRMQFARLAKESGIDAWERYFSTDEDGYEKAVELWLTKGEG